MTPLEKAFEIMSEGKGYVESSHGVHIGVFCIGGDIVGSAQQTKSRARGKNQDRLRGSFDDNDDTTFGRYQLLH